MRLLIRLIRIYTPFICTVIALLNGVLFKNGKFKTSNGEAVTNKKYVLAIVNLISNNTNKLK